MHPNAHMSDFAVYPAPWICSGAMYNGVPTFEHAKESEITTAANPKSATCTHRCRCPCNILLISVWYSQVCVHVCCNTYNLFSRVCAHIEVNVHSRHVNGYE